MILYRLDNIEEGAAIKSVINGVNTTLYRKEFKPAELGAAVVAGWKSLESIRHSKLARAIKPKGRAGLT